MPIYEFECGACGKFFEELIRGNSLPACPACHAENTRKLPSCACHHSAVSKSGDGSPYSSPQVASSGGGCGSCSGGNCSTCH